MLPHRRYIFQILPSDLVARNGKEWGAIHQHNHTSAFLLPHTLVQFASMKTVDFHPCVRTEILLPRGPFFFSQCDLHDSLSSLATNCFSQIAELT